MLISIGLGVLIIFLVARNFAKPLKVKLESAVFNESDLWIVQSWEDGKDYIYVGDTLGVFKNESGISEPVLSIYEGELVSEALDSGQEVPTGEIVARVKVDIWKIISDAFKRANYWWLLLSLVVSLLSHASRAARWKMMFKPLGHNVRFGNAFGAVLVMYLANLAFPRLGEVLRCSILARFEKVPIHKSLGTMITERVVDVISLGVVFVLCIILQRSIFIDFYYNYMPQEQGGYLKFIILGGGLLFFVAGFFLYRSGRLPFGNKIKELAIGLWDGIKSVKDLEKPWLFFAHSVFIWVCYIVMITVCLKALPETSSVTLLAGLPLLFFGGIAMVAVQGGLGLYPYFISKIILMYGVVETTGYAFGWVIWSAQTALVIVAGVIAFLFLTVFNKKQL